MAEIEDNELIIKLKEEKYRVYSEHGIPPDPYEWSVEHTLGWFRWICTFSTVGDTFDDPVIAYAIDGPSLCSMAEHDFLQMFGRCTYNADAYFRYLYHWRTVPPFSFAEDIKPTMTEKMQILNDIEEEKQNLAYTKIKEEPKSPLSDCCISSESYTDHSINPNELCSRPNFTVDQPDNTDVFSVMEPLDMSKTSSVYGFCCRTQSEHICNAECSVHERTPSMTCDADQSHVRSGTVSMSFDQQRLMQSTLHIEAEPVPQKRKRGRPRKPRPPESEQKKKRHPILWKFLLENLDDPNRSGHVTWVNKEDGVFRFSADSKEELARKWGERKGNRNTMTYQKMARALRHYGKKNIISKHRRRLHYRFFPKCLSKDLNKDRDHR
ncbi:transcriptional regulator Erg-like [Glandiceps talaboti]